MAIATLDVELLDNRLSTLFAPNGHAALTAGWTPAANLQETAEGLLVTLEIPGVGRDEIEIQVENDTLVVKGEKRAAEPEHAYHLHERPQGTFRRAFRMPRWVEIDAISADLEHGVLSIRLPKAEAARPRRIEVGANRPVA